VNRNVKTNTGGTIFNRTRQCHLYADYVVVLGGAVKYIADTAEDMTAVASDTGLTINVSKTKRMINRKINVNQPQGQKRSYQKASQKEGEKREDLD
jgi:hypothetical protein